MVSRGLAGQRQCIISNSSQTFRLHVSNVFFVFFFDLLTEFLELLLFLHFYLHMYLVLLLFKVS